MDAPTPEAVNTATRVVAGDDRTRYDPVATALHWATVVLVLANFALGETWSNFARPTRHLMIVTHMSFGILLAAVVIARIASPKVLTLTPRATAYSTMSKNRGCIIGSPSPWS